MTGGAKMIVDYAHHPKQIEYAISSAYYNLPDDGDLIVLFEPHTYSRTKALFKDFCKVLRFGLCHKHCKGKICIF